MALNPFSTAFVPKVKQYQSYNPFLDNYIEPPEEMFDNNDEIDNSNGNNGNLENCRESHEKISTNRVCSRSGDSSTMSDFSRIDHLKTKTSPISKKLEVYSVKDDTKLNPFLEVIENYQEPDKEISSKRIFKKNSISSSSSSTTSDISGINYFETTASNSRSPEILEYTSKDHNKQMNPFFSANCNPFNYVEPQKEILPEKKSYFIQEKTNTNNDVERSKPIQNNSINNDIKIFKNTNRNSYLKNQIEELSSTGETSPNQPSNSDELSESDIDLLDISNIKTTTNVMKAVLGYVPKDDTRICPFYNPKIDGCFKGSSCRLEHVKQLENGWTRDLITTTIDIRNKIVYPSIGSFITIIPTHIVNSNVFYAHINLYQLKYEKTLRELIYKMNLPEECIKFKKFNELPKRFDLILAKYTDDSWYRARLLNIIDETRIKVFYVDYGNSLLIWAKDIRQWEPKFVDLPFQAILCKINGVEEIRSNSIEATDILRETIINQKIKANVISNVDILNVELFDDDGNIGERLIAQNLVARKEFILPKVNQKCFPG